MCVLLMARCFPAMLVVSVLQLYLRLGVLPVFLVKLFYPTTILRTIFQKR